MIHDLLRGKRGARLMCAAVARAQVMKGDHKAEAKEFINGHAIKSGLALMIQQCTDNNMDCTFIRGMQALGNKSESAARLPAAAHVATRALVQHVHVWQLIVREFFEFVQSRTRMRGPASSCATFSFHARRRASSKRADASRFWAHQRQEALEAYPVMHMPSEARAR
jgi:hypothetical protein